MSDKTIKKYCEEAYDYFVEIGLEKYLKEMSLSPEEMSKFVIPDLDPRDHRLAFVIFYGLSPQGGVLLHLLKENFGIDLPEESVQESTQNYKDAKIILRNIEEDETENVRIFIHEFWHLIELRNFGRFDPIAEGTAEYVRVNYPRTKTFIENLEYKSRTKLEFDPLAVSYEKVHKIFDLILYDYGNEIVSEHVKKPIELLKNKELRRKLNQKLLSKFYEVFDKKMTSKLLVFYTINMAREDPLFLLNVRTDLEHYFVQLLSYLRLERVSDEFSRNGIPREILNELHQYVSQFL